MPMIGTKTHIASDLTRFSIMVAGAKETVSDVILPVVNVRKDTDKWYIKDWAHITDDSDDLLGPTQEPTFITYDATTAEYSIKEYEKADFIRDRDRANADPGLTLDRGAVKRLVSWHKIKIEKRVKTKMETLKTTTDRNTARQVKWSASAGTRIEDDIRKADRIIQKFCGFPATHIVFQPDVYDALVRAPELKALRKSTNDLQLINGNLPNRIFGKISVLPGCIEQTANIGDITLPTTGVSTSFVWGEDDVYLLYINPNPQKDDMTFGLQLRQIPFYSRRIPNPKRGGGGMEVYVGYAQDEQFTFDGAGHVITGVLT